VKLRIGTRGSRLALVQSNLIAAPLRALGIEIEVVPIRTSGDRLAQVALADFGGKALFVKEIEEGLLDGRVDLAVHSLKDLPAVLPDGLVLGAFPVREDPRDVLVTRRGGTLEDLPGKSVVGTSSLRRKILVLGRRQDLDLRPIRGNVDTRLAKLEDGMYDAVIVAQAGLNRLGLSPVHATLLAVDDFPPAVGQGILAVEARGDDTRTLELLERVDDTRTRMEALAERSFLRGLAAGCHTPVAGYACTDAQALTLAGLVASLDGRTVIRSVVSGPSAAAEALGQKLAEELLARGAAGLLAANEDGRP
jgi:hydroxymethylbilane synthase